MGQLFIPQGMVWIIFTWNWEFPPSFWDERVWFRIWARFQRRRAWNLLSWFNYSALLLFQNILGSPQVLQPSVRSERHHFEVVCGAEVLNLLVQSGRNLGWNPRKVKSGTTAGPRIPPGNPQRDEHPSEHQCQWAWSVTCGGFSKTSLSRNEEICGYEEFNPSHSCRVGFTHKPNSLSHKSGTWGSLFGHSLSREWRWFLWSWEHLQAWIPYLELRDPFLSKVGHPSFPTDPW